MINNWTIFRVSLRGFLISSTLNYQQMQGRGLLFALRPALKKIYPSQKEYTEVANRHLEYFNTNPYLVSLILGMIIKMEEKFSKKEISSFQISSFKKVISGPLAGISDDLIWGLWRPLIALISLNLYIWLMDKICWWYPIICFLIFYNLPLLWIRIWGVWRGYKGGELAGFIQHIHYQKIRKILKVTGIIFTFFLIAGFFSNLVSKDERIYFALLIAVLWGLLKLRVHPKLLFYSLVVFGIIGSVIKHLMK